MEDVYYILKNNGSHLKSLHVFLIFGLLQEISDPLKNQFKMDQYEGIKLENLKVLKQNIGKHLKL